MMPSQALSLFFDCCSQYSYSAKDLDTFTSLTPSIEELSKCFMIKSIRNEKSYIFIAYMKIFVYNKGVRNKIKKTRLSGFP